MPFRLEKMDATSDYILMDGNTAAALGALYAGATVGAWYPITPSTSLMEALPASAERYRVDRKRDAKYAILQAEDELAAAGIVIGAAGQARVRSRRPPAPASR